MTKRKVGVRAEWATDAVIALIRAEWDKGTPLRGIANLVGVSKSTISGKIERLNLPARSGRTGRPGITQWTPEMTAELFRLRHRRMTPWVETAAALGVSFDAAKTHYRNEMRRRFQEMQKVDDSAAPPLAPPIRVRQSAPAPAWTPPPPLDLRTSTCCWPIGEPGTRTFRFCDAPTCHSRSPYCVDHHDGAYVRVFRDDTGRAYYGAGGVAAGAGAAGVVEVFAATAAASACEELVTD